MNTYYRLPMYADANAYKAHVEPILTAAAANLAQLALPPPPGTTKLVQIDAWLKLLDTPRNETSLIRSTHPDAALRAMADDVESQFNRLLAKFYISTPIYQALQQLPLSEDAATRHWQTHLLDEFKRSGAGLPPAQQQRVLALREEISQLGVQFDAHIRDDVRSICVTNPAALDGLPEDYRRSHIPDAQGCIRITTQTPDMLPFMRYAHADDLRRQLLIQARLRGYPHNEPVLQQLIAKRDELAKLLGFAHYADLITQDKMAASASNVQAFIDDVAKLARPQALREYATLLHALQQRVADATVVEDWQKSYLEEQVKHAQFALDTKALRRYFAYDKVREGLFALCEQLFGIQIRRNPDLSGWHESVETFDVWEQNQLVGRFYLDMHPRDHKYQHAAAFALQTGTTAGELPSAALVCNFSQSLMEHADVVTFFHEFGHLLHHLMARHSKWVAQGGIACEWDFVEAPSQFFEEWAYQPWVLQTFAKDDAGKPLPDDLIAALVAARDFGRGLWVSNQLFYAALSLQLHESRFSAEAIQALSESLQSQYSLFRVIPATHFHLSFGHLEGYSALYYTYMWSLVIAKDLYAQFSGPSSDVYGLAQVYRQTILEPGGQLPAKQMLVNFLRRDVSHQAFNQWLCKPAKP